MRIVVLLIAVVLFGAWTHGGGGVLLTDASGVLLTNVNGDLLAR